MEYFIIHNDTGARLCKDGAFRRTVTFGTTPGCMKFYKKKGYAIRLQNKLLRQGTETTITPLHHNETIDSKGKIVSIPDLKNNYNTVERIKTMVYAQSNQIFVNFGCDCRKTVYKVPVSELIAYGVPTCASCGSPCSEVSDVEIEVETARG